MAKSSSEGPHRPNGTPVAPRGVALIKAAITAAQASGRIPQPEPVLVDLLDRLRLPSGEPLTPSMRALFAFDASWLGLGIDAEDAELEVLELEEVVAEALGDDVVPLFGEAYELLSDDCLPIGDGEVRAQFVYVGNPDAAGEYAVITVDTHDGPRVSGFVPFDVWVAQRLGALTEPLPAAYAGASIELSRLNGDGRTSFRPEPDAAE